MRVYNIKIDERLLTLFARLSFDVHKEEEKKVQKMCRGGGDVTMHTQFFDDRQQKEKNSKRWRDVDIKESAVFSGEPFSSLSFRFIRAFPLDEWWSTSSIHFREPRPRFECLLYPAGYLPHFLSFIFSVCLGCRRRSFERKLFFTHKSSLHVDHYVCIYIRQAYGIFI